MYQQPKLFNGLPIDRLAGDIPDFKEERPPPFEDTGDGDFKEERPPPFEDTGDGVRAEGWTFFKFLEEWKYEEKLRRKFKKDGNEINVFEEKLWWKFNKNGEIIGFESEGRKMFLGIAEIVISFHERKMFSGNLVRRIRILPDLNVTHKSPPRTEEKKFEDGGQRSDIVHFRWMVAAMVRTTTYKISSKFLLFFSEIFTVQEGLKDYFVSQLYHPIFFNSSDKCNLIRMMRDLYNLNPYIFRRHFELESYGFKYWWLKIDNGRYSDAFRGVLNYNSNFNSLYNESNGFALPLYIRNVHEHFFQKGRFYHENIDSEIDNLFPGLSAAIIDSAIRNLHGYWDYFGSTLQYLQRTSPYGWCFPYYRFRN